MGYVIRPSWGRCVVALVLMAAAMSVFAPMLYSYLSAALSEGSSGALAIGRASLAVASCAAFAAIVVSVWLRWRYESDRQVRAIRLMGGPGVLLYFPAPPSRLERTARTATARHVARPVASIIPLTGPFPYDGHPAMAVTVTRVVHWPKCLIALTFDAVRPADGALDRLAGPRLEPRAPGVLQLLLGGWAAKSCGAAATVPMRAPRHLVIFADAMSAPQFRSLAISLACLQRGVTFVEHR